MSVIKNEWYTYEELLYHNQVLPKERKNVLLMVGPSYQMPCCVVVGYMKYAAGDKYSPYFITPGFGKDILDRKIIAWCDGLSAHIKSNNSFVYSFLKKEFPYFEEVKE